MTYPLRIPRQPIKKSLENLLTTQPKGAKLKESREWRAGATAPARTIDE